MKKDMGGLRKKMPITFVAWIVSTLALTGVFPFAGFWSKDEIIDNVGNNGYTFLMWVGLGGAVLTAMYMTRATYLTFFGEPRGASAGEHHGDEHGEEHEMEHISVGAPEPRSLSSAANTGHAHGGEGSASDEPHGGHGGSEADDGSDHHDDGPHESGPLIIVPIVILASLALVAGLANPTPLASRFGEGVEALKTYVEPRATPVAFEQVIAAGGPGESLTIVDGRPQAVAERRSRGGPRAKRARRSRAAASTTPNPVPPASSPPSAMPSRSSPRSCCRSASSRWATPSPSAFNVQFYGRRNKRLVGLTERSRFMRGGFLFLKNKYYLDALYENVIVRAIAHPIAKGTDWFNQNVIDAAVNDVGKGARRTGEWVYDNIDQKVVDGAVDGSGWIASESGHGLQPTQSGKVSQYGALLFGAAAVGAIVLVLVNVS